MGLYTRSNDSTKNIEDPNWEDYTTISKPITKKG